MPERRTGFKVTPWRAFLGWTLFFCLAIGLDAARDGRVPFDAGVFCGTAFLGVLMTIVLWAAGVWKARSRT